MFASQNDAAFRRFRRCGPALPLFKQRAGRVLEAVIADEGLLDSATPQHPGIFLIESFSAFVAATAVPIIRSAQGDAFERNPQ